MTAQSIQREEILEALLRLHAWRENHNGEDIGFGADELFGNETEKLHFPHAYAIWGTGYINLYKLTGEEKYFEEAKCCAKWLIDNPSPKYKNLSWGFLFGWQGSDPELSFCITTIYCGNLFYELYRITNEGKYADVLNSIRQWCIEENGYEVDLKETKGIWFRYANSSVFPRSVYSLTAMVAGFFAKLYSIDIGDKEENAYFAASCARYVLNSQKSSGFWHYNDIASKIDLIHTALLLEGLGDFSEYTNFLRPDVINGLGIGCKFLSTKMFRKNGYALESYPKLLVAPWKIEHFREMVSFMRNLVFKRPILETRTYGYGMAIKALSKSAKILGKNPVDYGIAAKYLLRHHQKENGDFRFRGDISHEYIRAQGHIFDGLSYFLLEVNSN